LEATQLAFEDRRRILEGWIQDEEALLVADEEGMTGMDRPHLREALLALEQLLATNRQTH